MGGTQGVCYGVLLVLFGFDKLLEAGRYSHVGGGTGVWAVSGEFEHAVFVASRS